MWSLQIKTNNKPTYKSTLWVIDRYLMEKRWWTYNNACIFGHVIGSLTLTPILWLTGMVRVFLEKTIIQAESPTESARFTCRRHIKYTPRIAHTQLDDGEHNVRSSIQFVGSTIAFIIHQLVCEYILVYAFAHRDAKDTHTHMFGTQVFFSNALSQLTVVW